MSTPQKKQKIKKEIKEESRPDSIMRSAAIKEEEPTLPDGDEEDDTKGLSTNPRKKQKIKKEIEEESRPDSFIRSQKIKKEAEEESRAAVKKEEPTSGDEDNVAKAPDASNGEEEAETRTMDHVKGFMDRLESVWNRRRIPRVVTLIVLRKDLVKDGVVPSEYLDDQTVTITSSESKRWGGHGREFAQGGGGFQDGEECYRRGPVGDTLWLLGIERGDIYGQPPPPRLSTKPSIKGELYAIPADACHWYLTYGSKPLMEDMKSIGYIPGPFDGPSLAPIVKQIYTLVGNKF